MFCFLTQKFIEMNFSRFETVLHFLVHLENTAKSFSFRFDLENWADDRMWIGVAFVWDLMIFSYIFSHCLGKENFWWKNKDNEICLFSNYLYNEAIQPQFIKFPPQMMEENKFSVCIKKFEKLKKVECNANFCFSIPKYNVALFTSTYTIWKHFIKIPCFISGMCRSILLIIMRRRCKENLIWLDTENIKMFHRICLFSEINVKSSKFPWHSSFPLTSALKSDVFDTPF